MNFIVIKLVYQQELNFAITMFLNISGKVELKEVGSIFNDILYLAESTNFIIPKFFLKYKFTRSKNCWCAN